MSDLKEETNFDLRKWKLTWWMNQRSIMKILARHDSAYVCKVTGSKVFVVDGEEPANSANQPPPAKSAKIEDGSSPKK